MDAVVERLDVADDDGLEVQVGPDLTASLVDSAEMETSNMLSNKEPDLLRASLSDVVLSQSLTLAPKGDIELEDTSADEKRTFDGEFDNIIMAGDISLVTAGADDDLAPSTEEKATAIQSSETQGSDDVEKLSSPPEASHTGEPDLEEQTAEEHAQSPTSGLRDSVTIPPASAEDFEDVIDPALLVSSLRAEHDSDDEFDFDLPEAGSKPANDKTVRFSGVGLADSGDSQAKVVTPKVGAQEEEKGAQVNSSGEAKAAINVGTLSTAQSSGSEILHQVDTKTGTGGSAQVAATDVKHDQDDKDEEDKSRDHIITSSAADWDNVETVEAGFSDLQPGEGSESMTLAPALLSFPEIWQHFRSVDHTDVKDKIQTSVDRRGFSAFVRLLFGPPKLHRDLQAERELVFCVAATALDNADSFHTQSLQTIYRVLTGSRFNCQRFGSHWEEIGFQGRDPATDLRGTGMLAIIQLLHFLQDPSTAQLARDLYKLSLHPTQNFPFCVMCINISRICLQSLREDILNKECNKQHAVMNVVNQYYSGALLHLYRLWKQGKTISDSGFVIKEVETRSKKSAKDVFRDLQAYIASQKPTADVPGEGEVNFFSVVKGDQTKSAAELY